MAGYKKEELHDGQDVRLKQLIKELSLSEHGFAKKVGLSGNYFFQFRKYRSALTDTTSLKIKKAVPNLNTEWLRKGEGDKTIDGGSFRLAGAEPEVKSERNAAVNAKQAAPRKAAKPVPAEDKEEPVGSLNNADELASILAKTQRLNESLQKQNFEYMERIIELTEKALRQQELITKLLQEKLESGRVD